MPNSQLIIRQPSPTPAKVDAETTSLLEWFVRYGEAEVAGRLTRQATLLFGGRWYVMLWGRERKWRERIKVNK